MPMILLPQFPCLWLRVLYTGQYEILSCSIYPPPSPSLPLLYRFAIENKKPRNEAQDSRATRGRGKTDAVPGFHLRRRASVAEAYNRLLCSVGRASCNCGRLSAVVRGLFYRVRRFPTTGARFVRAPFVFRPREKSNPCFYKDFASAGPRHTG